MPKTHQNQKLVSYFIVFLSIVFSYLFFSEIEKTKKNINSNKDHAGSSELASKAKTNFNELIPPPNHNFKKFNRSEITFYISQDLQMLKIANALPDEWRKIGRIQHNYHTEWAKNHFTEKPFIKPNIDDKNYQYNLEIEYLDTTEEIEENDPMLIIQMSLIDKDSKNKIWEMSRAYQAISDRKKKPE